MPYKVVVLALRFFERESEMASRRENLRGLDITVEEFIRRVQDKETDTGGLSSHEESDLDQQLYDMEDDRR